MLALLTAHNLAITRAFDAAVGSIKRKIGQSGAGQGNLDHAFKFVLAGRTPGPVAPRLLPNHRQHRGTPVRRHRLSCNFIRSAGRPWRRPGDRASHKAAADLVSQCAQSM